MSDFHIRLPRIQCVDYTGDLALARSTLIGALGTTNPTPKSTPAFYPSRGHSATKWDLFFIGLRAVESSAITPTKTSGTTNPAFAEFNLALHRVGLGAHPGVLRLQNLHNSLHAKNVERNSTDRRDAFGSEMEYKEALLQLKEIVRTVAPGDRYNYFDLGFGIGHVMRFEASDRAIRNESILSAMRAKTIGKRLTGAWRVRKVLETIDLPEDAKLLVVKFLKEGKRLDAKSIRQSAKSLIYDLEKYLQ